MDLTVENRESAFFGNITCFAIINNGIHIDPTVFLNAAFAPFETRVNQEIQMIPLIKIQACLVAKFEKPDVSDNNNILSTVFYGATKMMFYDRDSELQPWYAEHVINVILQRIEKFQAEGSGWTLASIIELQVTLCKYIGYRGSSYIELPKPIQNKKAVINVRNYDNLCFKYAVYSKFRYENGQRKHCDRIGNYTNLSFLNGIQLNFGKVIYPMDVARIKHFESSNENVSVNVYVLKNRKNSNGFNEEIVVPLRLTREVKVHHVNLLLLQQQAAWDIINTHYCWISNFSALISKQVSKHNGQIYICNRCLHYFQTQIKLDKHFENCMKQNQCAIVLPTVEENKLKFENFKNQIRVPFCIYADIEAILQPLDENDDAGDGDGNVFNGASNTRAYQKHIACSVGYYLKSDIASVPSRYAKDRSPHCVKWFVRQLYEIYEEVENVLNTIAPMNLTTVEEAHFQSATTCHICGNTFQQPTDIKTRDHDHLTGNNRLNLIPSSINLNIDDF